MRATHWTANTFLVNALEQIERVLRRRQSESLIELYEHLSGHLHIETIKNDILLKFTNRLPCMLMVAGTAGLSVQ